MKIERLEADVTMARKCRSTLKHREAMGKLPWVHGYDWMIDNKQGMAPSTMANYESNFNKMHNSGAFTTVADLNEYDSISKYIKFLSKGLKPSTVEVRISFLKNLCCFLHPLGVFGWNVPLQFTAFPGLGTVKLPQEVELKQVLTKDEIDRIIKAGYSHKNMHFEWLIDMFMFMYYTGRRYQTVINLRKEDVNMEEGTVYFRHDKALHGHDIKRTVIMSGGIGEKLLKIIERAKKRTRKSVVFTTSTNAPWNRKTTYLAELFQKKLYGPAGVTVDHDKVHILRRSSATHQLESGRSIEQVKHWSGWNSDKTLERIYDMRLKTEERKAPVSM